MWSEEAPEQQLREQGPGRAGRSGAQWGGHVLSPDGASDLRPSPEGLGMTAGQTRAPRAPGFPDRAEAREAGGDRRAGVCQPGTAGAPAGVLRPSSEPSLWPSGSSGCWLQLAPASPASHLPSRKTTGHRGGWEHPRGADSDSAAGGGLSQAALLPAGLQLRPQPPPASPLVARASLQQGTDLREARGGPCQPVKGSNPATPVRERRWDHKLPLPACPEPSPDKWRARPGRGGLCTCVQDVTSGRRWPQPPLGSS